MVCVSGAISGRATLRRGRARASVPSSSYSEEHEQNEHAWHLQYGQWCSLWSAEQKAWQSANIRSPSRPELHRPVIAAAEVSGAPHQPHPRHLHQLQWSSASAGEHQP